MWVGQQLADGLDFWGFLGSLILGGIILGIYTGLLGYVGAKTGLSLDLLSQRAFGEKGSYLPSAMTSFTQIGWFGVGSFVSGGTATPNFARFAKNGKAGAITTVVAFFIGNSLMFFFGAVSSIFVGGNDIFEVMVRLNLFYLAVLVLGLNIWTTNDNALYTAGLGLANIFHQRKKPMVLLSGIIGTVASVWLYYNFCGWCHCCEPLTLRHRFHQRHGCCRCMLLCRTGRKQKKITITPLACFSLSSWKHVQGFLFLLIRVIMYA